MERRGTCIFLVRILFISLFLIFSQKSFPQCSPKYGDPPLNTIFNTGNNGNNGVLSGGKSDLNWYFTKDSINAKYNNAIVVTNPNYRWYKSPWSNAAWISHSANASHNGNIDYYYKYNFDLPCFNQCGKSFNDSNTFCLNLDFFADNSVYEIYINGKPQSKRIGNMPKNNPYQQVGYSSAGIVSVSLCHDWKVGNNTIIVHIKSSQDAAGFLAQASIDPPKDITDTIYHSICKGEIYKFGSQNLTKTGIYKEIFHPLPKCDSIVVLNLNIKTISKAKININICEGETYKFHNKEINSTGKFYDTLIKSVGCDSILEIDLKVKSKSYFIINHSICKGQTYLGFDTSGIYIDTLVTANGCDSIRTIILKVNPIRDLTINKSICQGQSFSGYNSTGTYKDTLQAVNGCDSIRTLILKVHLNSNFMINKSICQGQSFLGYNSTGTYIDSFISNKGCDSIQTLFLTVNQPYNDSVSKTICYDTSFKLCDGRVVNSSRVYTCNLKSKNGCDSIVTVSLLLLPITSDSCRSLEVIFPNVFSPDNNLLNDEFKPVIIGDANKIINYNFKIFDRWGELIFKSDYLNNGWKGDYLNNPCQLGAYMWTCHLKFSYMGEDKLEQHKGIVFLLR